MAPWQLKIPMFNREYIFNPDTICFLGYIHHIPYHFSSKCRCLDSSRPREKVFTNSEKSGFICHSTKCDHPGNCGGCFLGGGGSRALSESVLGFNCTDFACWFRGPLRCFNS